MKQLHFVVLFIFITMSCKEQAIKTHSNHVLRQKRLEARTVTEFLEIGNQQDTLAISYSDLKYDSIEAIDFKFEPAFVIESESGINDLSPKDTIVSRHLLTSKQASYLTTTIDSKKTYEDAIPANCFNPHMIFVFYRKDSIIANYSVCLGCMRVYSTIKPHREFSKFGLGEYGGNLLSEICQELKFSHCEYSKLPR
jgi:hypothetical protein